MFAVAETALDKERKEIMSELSKTEINRRAAGMQRDRIQDWLIIETWLHINDLMLPCQIGAIPALAARGGPTC